MTSRAVALILAAALLVAPLATGAQQPAKVPRIGVLTTGAPGASPFLDAFGRGLRELGYVEGQNIVLEIRRAEGRLDRFPGLAAELVASGVDLILAGGTVAAQAAKGATTAIPIVFTLVADPLDAGLVASLARPGGNVTGVSSSNTELSAKRLELLREAFPRVSRLGALFNPVDRSNALALAECEAGARASGVALQPLAARDLDEIKAAFSTIKRQRPDALLVFAGALNVFHRASIVSLVAETRLPTMYSSRDFVDAGGLMSYATNFPDQSRRAARYVDRILKGARPAELPIEQPTTFELVVNLKTARALGLSISPSVLARADEIIQ